jgi:hypothetical protein
MKTCHICGEVKETKEFHRIKRFREYKEKRVVWCQDCQRMYVAMKKQEEREKKLEEKDWSFQVVFK